MDGKIYSRREQRRRLDNADDKKYMAAHACQPFRALTNGSDLRLIDTGVLLFP